MFDWEMLTCFDADGAGGGGQVDVSGPGDPEAAAPTHQPVPGVSVSHPVSMVSVPTASTAAPLNSTSIAAGSQSVPAAAETPTNPSVIPNPVDWQNLAKQWQSRYDQLKQSHDSLQKLHTASEEVITSLSSERDALKGQLNAVSEDHTKTAAELQTLQKKHGRLETIVTKHADLLPFYEEISLFPEEGDALTARLDVFAAKVGTHSTPQSKAPSTHGAVPPVPAESSAPRLPQTAMDLFKQASEALRKHDTAKANELMDQYYQALKKQGA